MLLLLNTIFGGSILGIISATAGSTLISLYLIYYPIKLLSKETEDDIKEFFSIDDIDTISTKFTKQN